MDESKSPGARDRYWRSRAGFILAALGSAAGLGNIWRFAHVAGENGGGAFFFVTYGRYLHPSCRIADKRNHGREAMFKSILVATDGSGYSNRAVATACDLAAKLGAPLTVVHVLGHGHLSPDMAKMLEVEHLVERERFRSPRVEEVSGNIGLAMREDTVAYEFRAWRVVGEQIVERARTAARNAGARVAGAFLDDGEPVDRIVERARESEADLIVLGRRGLSDLHGLVVGSVTHKVSQLADCACLTVK